jgi:hypothetical protein
MKISLDFEGVVSAPWSEEELSGLDRALLRASALSVAGARPRFGVRSLVSLLGAFARVEILTARRERERPAIAAWLAQHLPELAGAAVHACPPEARGRFVCDRGIALHLDRDARAAVGAEGRCLVWERESVEAMAAKVAAALSRCAGLRFAGRRVDAITPLPSFSSTPVQRVDTPEGVFKLRLVEDAAQAARLRRLHQLAADRPALAELLPPLCAGLPAHVHAVPFLRGQTIEHLPRVERLSLVGRVARWQEALHACTAQADGTCLVSCAGDAFNLCIGDDGTAAIIDAADCLEAPRWLDLIWTERLLCPWTGGARHFFESYFARTAVRPRQADVDEALAGYYFWHHSIVRSSLRRRAADPAATAMLRQVKAWRAPAPTGTLLHEFATDVRT